MKNRKVLFIGLAIVVVMLFQPFSLFNYGGGWEVSVKATQARVDSGQWVNTDPAQWQYDFDAKYSGAPDLIIDSGLDPVHVNQYFYPSPSNEPAFEPITKKLGDSEFVYDVHIYTMDITLRTDGDYLMTDTAGSNNFESEASYSHEALGDGGSHLYNVRFSFDIQGWDKFTDEDSSWSGIMSIFTYKAPTVGVQKYSVQNLVSGYDYDFAGGYTEVQHNPFPGTQGSKLNMFTDKFQSVEHTSFSTLSPDTGIPSKVFFDLGVDFRAGALVGEDFWGNEETMYILDPYVIFHIGFELLTVHQYYLETSQITITQAPAVDSGSPGTRESEGPWYEQLGGWFDDMFGFLGGLKGFLIIALVVVVLIAVAPTILGALGANKTRKMLR